MTTVVPPLRISVWQTASHRSDVAANLAALDAAAARARAEGSELLITPEMFLTGYAIGDDIARLASDAPLERVSEIARRNNVAIVAGGPATASVQEPPHTQAPGTCGERDRGVVNAAWFYDAEGTCLARHAKLQLFGELDREHFIAGDRPVTLVDYRGFRIALLICFDVEFPEAVRAAAHAGADLVAVPTAQMVPFAFVNEHLIRVRAWENSVYIAYANHIGRDGPFDYVGRSVVASPLGEHLAFASPASTELLTVDLRTDRLRRARAQNPYLAEVRSELFSREHCLGDTESASAAPQSVSP